jgi:hypothetical protein
VHTSIGRSGYVMRSNTYGTTPLTVGAAQLAPRDKDSAIQRGSGRSLTFNDKPTSTKPPGGIAYAVLMNLTIPQMADFVVDLYLPSTANAPFADIRTHRGVSAQLRVGGPQSHGNLHTELARHRRLESQHRMRQTVWSPEFPKDEFCVPPADVRGPKQHACSCHRHSAGTPGEEDDPPRVVEDVDCKTTVPSRSLCLSDGL